MPHVALLPCCLVACCQWSFLNSTLPAACCMLHVALHVVFCSLHVARCMAHVVRKLCDARCVLSFAVSMLHVACRRLHFPDACCMLHVVCCTFSSGRLWHAARWIVSACPFFVACRTFSVAWCLISVARPTVPCRMPCALSVACPASHLVTLHVAWRTLSVACCLLSVACPVLHVVCCMSSVACCRVTLRSRARSASQRRLQFRPQ